MTIRIHFYSYFKDLTGCPWTEESVVEGSTIDQLLGQLHVRFPKLTAMRNSTLIAVGVDYQDRGYVLKAGEEVSLFPPVQGG